MTSRDDWKNLIEGEFSNANVEISGVTYKGIFDETFFTAESNAEQDQVSTEARVTIYDEPGLQVNEGTEIRIDFDGPARVFYARPEIIRDQPGQLTIFLKTNQN